MKRCTFKSRIIVDYDKREKTLRFIKIRFSDARFDIITKDRAVKFVNILSDIGGTMGLLTGFSIITAVEIVYFTTKIIIGFFKKIPKQTVTKISIDS